MKLPKNYFENLTINKYREYLKLLPNMQEENTRIITTLILTFLAMSFFGIFAINPTLSTIVTLKKQLADSELVHEKLKTKINNLSSIQQQYTQLNSDLPVVFEAIPKVPHAPTLMGQIFALSKKTGVRTTSLTVSNIQLLEDKKASGSALPDPLRSEASQGGQANFSLQTQGQYEALMNFAKSLTQINRIISVDSMSIKRDPKSNTLTLDLSGRGYFKQ